MITKSRLLIVIVGLLFQPGFRITTADLLLRPRDTEALVGFPTFFNCSSTINSEIQWFHYPDGDNKQRHLVYGYNKFYAPYDTRCRIEKDESNGVYNLVINKVTADDFGKYQCQDDFGRGAEATAQLIVLESLPVCESSMSPEGVIASNLCGIQPEDLQLTCGANFRGNQPPSIVWTATGSESAITEGATSNISANRAVYKLTWKPKSRDIGSTFECRTTKAATTQFGCTSGTVRENGSNTNFYILCTILAATIALCLVLFTCCTKFYLDKRKLSLGQNKEQFPLVERSYKNDNDHEFVEKLKTENQRLTAKVAELEERLYFKGKIQYDISSEAVSTTDRVIAAIRGITLLGDELFAVFEKSQVVEVYDSVTFTRQKSFTVNELWDPHDITSCNTYLCLYIIHHPKRDTDNQILKIDAKSEATVNQWSVECMPDLGRLSMHESNIIVSVPEQQRIIEYLSNGKEQATVRLSPAEGLGYLWHAIKVTRAHFLVSSKDSNTSQHKLCLIDYDGKVLAKSNAFEDCSPICLLEDKDKSIMVLNATSHNITLLNSDLKHAQKILQLSENYYGLRICLDEKGSQLFVAVNECDRNSNIWHSGRIILYKVKLTTK